MPIKGPNFSGTESDRLENLLVQWKKSTNLFLSFEHVEEAMPRERSISGLSTPGASKFFFLTLIKFSFLPQTKEPQLHNNIKCSEVVSGTRVRRAIGNITTVVVMVIAL